MSGLAMRYVGVWVSTRIYYPGDVVLSDGAEYVCLLRNKHYHQPPDETYWTPLGAGPVDPGTLSRLQSNLSVAQTGIASAHEEFAIWETPPATLVGSNLEVDALDNTLINVLADGIYSVGAFLSIAGAFTEIQATLYPGPQRGIDAYADIVCGFADFPLSFPPWYFEAGDTFKVSAYASTSAGTWAINQAFIWVQQLA